MKKLLLLSLLCIAAKATVVAPITTGQVQSVTITANGTSGCVNPTVTFAAAPSGGVTAVGTVVVAGGVVTGVTITTAGQGYGTVPTATFTQGSCSVLPTGTSVLGTLATLTWYTYASTGSNSNGGCFDTSLGGTNFANAAAATVVFSAGNANQLSAAQNSTTVTSAGTPFLATHVGNCIQITGGTNMVAGIYEITAFTSSSQVTFDRAPATAGAGSAGNGNLGGALATLDPTTGLTLYQESGTVANIKATANYPQAVNFTMPLGTPGHWTVWRGFSVNPGDNVQATIAPTVLSASTINAYGDMESLFWDGGGSFFVSSGVNLRGTSYAFNVTVNHFTTAGFTMSQTNSAMLVKTVAENGKASCTAGYNQGVSANRFYGSIAANNNCDGFKDTTAAPTSVYVRTLSYGNIGASSHGYEFTGNGTLNGPTFFGVVAYNNGGSGIACTGADACDAISVNNSIFVNNSGSGITSVVTNWAGTNLAAFNYNAFFGNGSDLNNLVHGPNDFCASGCSGGTLTGQPFNNPGGGDFSLNNTAGAGALLRTAGWPGQFPLGLSTGFLDIGAVQTTTSSGIGTNIKSSNITQTKIQ